VRRARGKTCMLSINRLKVNNSTQLNFTSPTGKGIKKKKFKIVFFYNSGHFAYSRECTF
jgi:hypothetical protein